MLYITFFTIFGHLRWGENHQGVKFKDTKLITPSISFYKKGIKCCYNPEYEIIIYY